MTPRPSQTARHSFGHGTIFFPFFSMATKQRCSQASPDLTEVLSLPSFPAPRVTLLSFFSRRCAARKIFKSILRQLCLPLNRTLLYLLSLLASLSILFHCLGRRDHRRGRHQTSEENHDNPPRSFVKFGALVKPRETIVTYRGVETEGRCYEWLEEGRMIPFRNAPAVPQLWS